MTGKLRLVGTSAIDEQISADGLRAKALPLGASHGPNDATQSKRRQGDPVPDPTTMRMHSKVRTVWRLSGLNILRDLRERMEISLSELATMLDLQEQQMGRQFQGRDPFSVENFVGLAERDPELGGEIIVAYADECLLPADVLDATAERLRLLAQERRLEAGRGGSRRSR